MRNAIMTVRTDITKANIKSWLDMQIGAMRIQNIELTVTEKPALFDEDEIVPDLTLTNCSRNHYIHISSRSLRYIAKMLDLEITAEDRSADPDYKYEISFIYNGVRFISLESEKEYNESEGEEE